jgi:hypothetical protein
VLRSLHEGSRHRQEAQEEESRLRREEEKAEEEVGPITASQGSGTLWDD